MSDSRLIICRSGDSGRAERIVRAAADCAGNNPDEAKKALRGFLRSERRAMCANDPDGVKRMDDAIQAALLDSEMYRECRTLLVYVSTGEEISTDRIIAQALADGKAVACPRCTSAGKMDFLRISSRDDLEAGRYGIMEPRASCEAVKLYTKNDLCVVPGLAFDRSGRRIGYGGGYYDRFLAAFPGRSAGLCRIDFLLDILPAGEYDMYVDCVICG